MTNECSNFDIQERNNLFHSDKSLNAEPEFVACCVEEDTQRSDEVSNNIKQERCGDNDNEDCNITIINNDVDVNLDDFVDVKPNAEDSVAEKLVFIDELKEEVNILRCEACGDDYDAYCPKCPMLVRILDADIPNKIENRIKQTLPKDFFDIREISPGGVGVIVLRAIPKGITFGPFEGLIPVIGENTTKWKISDGKLDYLRDPKRLNWMQYIRYSDVSLYRNLMPFQCENQLFYQSTRTIEEGEELLVYFDECGGEVNSDANNAYIQLLIIKEKLEDVYACTFCCLGFSSATYLSKHNSVCPGKKDKDISFRESAMIVQCTFCKIYLPENEYSEYHLSRCCTRNTNHRRRLTAATESKQEQEEEEVGEAENRSIRPFDRSTIVEEHRCDVCDRRFALKSILKRHQRTTHVGDAIDGPSSSSTKAKRFRCLQCPYETDVRKCLIRHGYVHAAEKPFKCDACDKSFTCRSSLKTHSRNAHPESAVRDRRCTICNYESDDGRRLQEHVERAHPENHVRRYECATCGYGTNDRGRYNQHVRIHTDAKNFQCGHCEKLFSSKSNLKMHIGAVHDPAKRYACAQCDYRTNRKAGFQQHLLIHESGVRFRCQMCNVGFSCRAHLKRHDEERHLIAARKYECGVCFGCFTQRASLEKHVRFVHADEESKFRCPAACGYSTSRKANMLRHSFVHQKVKPYRCVACGVGFASVDAFKKHNKRKHANVEATTAAIASLKEEIETD
ncbi:hypothetical protein Trydic_g14204 [Trypoxylus dichotomus]